MNHLFVPYDIALQLKEKGFNEPCLSKYSTTEILDIASTFGIRNSHLLEDIDYQKYGWICTAPLYQQVTDWLREKHGILAFADTVYDFSCHTPRLYQKENPSASYSGDFEYEDYYEALDAAILEALKLI